MDWEPYDYSIVYAEPYRVQQITSNWRLPFPVVLVNAATFLLVAIFEYLFLRSFISWVISFFPPAGVVFYIGLPYLCVLALAKLKPDGKKVHFYLWDWFCYMIRMMNGDCVYYNWDKVSNNALEELLFANKYVCLED
ncbi:TcpE family conjugal transfer membrane protein [Enterococcus faecalis]|uniref:TcpE family conjugal transfer membrane protein n=1 Tax=Enterococcus faecalis TaxID=1351 RepID=UPI001FA7A2FD|nr:TcpE family conjugal transfer membrane protein [Enterococcus faecalis]WGS34189.1 conjugal transfer protein [Enterococcus faecalis]